MDFKKQIKNVSMGLIVVMCILNLLITSLDFICPILLRNFISTYNTERFYTFLVMVLGAYILSLLIKMLYIRFKNWCSVKYKTRQTLIMYEAMESMNYVTLIEKEPTYLIEKINNCVNTFFSFYSTVISEYFISIFTIALCLGILFFLCSPVAIILIILIPIQLLGYFLLNKNLQNRCIELQNICARNFGKIISVLSKIDMLKNSKTNFVIETLLGKNVYDIHNENSNVSSYAERVSTVFENISAFLNVLIYVFTSIYLVKAKIEIQDFVYVSLVSNQCVNAVNKLLRANLNTRDLKGYKKFVDEELLANLEENKFNRLLNEKIDCIEMDIHDFGIKDKVLIESGNVTFKRNDVVFLHGESGCGKSSLMKALIRFYPIKTIKINGNDIKDYDIYSIRNKIFYMSQNIPIINGTILDNIILGENLKKNDVLKKISTFDFLDKFKNLENGFDTKIFENGANLSGGDKQRIAIARLLLLKPEIIILDEITNSLDSDNSKKIMDMILKNNKDSIIFVISHDKDIRLFCNKFVCIENKVLKMEQL